MEGLPAEILNIIFGYVNLVAPSINKYIYRSTKYSFLDHPKSIDIIDSNFHNILVKCLGVSTHTFYSQLMIVLSDNTQENVEFVKEMFPKLIGENIINGFRNHKVNTAIEQKIDLKTLPCLDEKLFRRVIARILNNIDNDLRSKNDIYYSITDDMEFLYTIISNDVLYSICEEEIEKKKFVYTPILYSNEEICSERLFRFEMYDVLHEVYEDELVLSDQE